MGLPSEGFFSRIESRAFLCESEAGLGALRGLLAASPAALVAARIAKAPTAHAVTRRARIARVCGSVSSVVRSLLTGSLIEISPASAGLFQPGNNFHSHSDVRHKRSRGLGLLNEAFVPPRRRRRLRPRRSRRP